MLHNTGQQETLYQKNRARMQFSNTGSWSAGEVIAKKKQKNGSARCYLDQQATLYQKNRTSMLLYNTGSCTVDFAVDFISDEPCREAVI